VFGCCCQTATQLCLQGHRGGEGRPCVPALVSGAGYVEAAPASGLVGSPQLSMQRVYRPEPANCFSSDKGGRICWLCLALVSFVTSVMGRYGEADLVWAFCTHICVKLVLLSWLRFWKSRGVSATLELAHSHHKVVVQRFNAKKRCVRVFKSFQTCALVVHAAER
jgi:hypothetical protein